MIIVVVVGIATRCYSCCMDTCCRSYMVAIVSCCGCRCGLHEYDSNVGDNV